MLLQYFAKHIPQRCEGITDKIKILFEDLYHDLNKYKNGIKNNDEWDKIKKLGNPYELIHISNKTIVNNSIASYNPVSRSYFKLWEILHDYPLLKQTYLDGTTGLEETYGLKICNLAEGPGGFMEAIINYRKNPLDNLYGITLPSTNKYIPSWKLMECNNINITYGNLYNKEDIEKYTGQFNRDVDFITADGGFDYSVDFNNQEEMSYHMIYSECIIALKIQKIGGTFICKIFDIFTIFTIKILYLLYCLYDKVYIVKPKTSRPANSEKYIIAIGFKGIDEKLLKDLEKIVYEWNDEIKDIRGIEIEEDFMKGIYEYNKSYVKNQIYYLNSIIDLTKNKPNKILYRTIIKQQTANAVEWCNKYEIIINNKSKYITYK